MNDSPAAGTNFKQLGPKPAYRPRMPRSLAMPCKASSVLEYTTLPFIAPTCTTENPTSYQNVWLRRERIFKENYEPVVNLHPSLCCSVENAKLRYRGGCANLGEPVDNGITQFIKYPSYQLLGHPSKPGESLEKMPTCICLRATSNGNVLELAIAPANEPMSKVWMLPILSSLLRRLYKDRSES